MMIRGGDVVIHPLMEFNNNGDLILREKEKNRGMGIVERERGKLRKKKKLRKKQLIHISYRFLLQLSLIYRGKSGAY